MSAGFGTSSSLQKMTSQGDKLFEYSDYVINIASEKDMPALQTFVRKFFYTDEPLNEAVHSCLNEAPTYIKDDSPIPYLSEALTLMAISHFGEIVGIALNAEVKPDEPVLQAVEAIEMTSGMCAMHKLLNHMEDRISEIARSGKNVKKMEVRVITVHGDWRNKGVGTVLLQHSILRAQKKGFKQIRSTCTSLYTDKMFTKSGFKTIYSLTYEECVAMGLLNCLPREPHTHIKAMLLKL